MEKDFILQSLFFQEICQGSQILCQKIRIFRALCVRVPAKLMAKRAVLPDHNLRCALSAPLGKQMRHFKMRNSGKAANSDPALQFRKIEAIGITVLADVQQLNRRALAADRSVQRRCKYGCQNRIDATRRIQADKVFQNLPVFFAERFYMIIVCQTVRMEPFRMQKLLRRKRRIDHMQVCF